MSHRRQFLKTLGLAAAAGAAPTAPLLAQAAPPKGDMAKADRGLVFDRTVPVIQTRDGPVKGYIRNGIHTFKGLPYGAPTGGENRFMPPKRPKPWTETLNAVAYSYACQQQHGDDWAKPLSHFVMNYDFGMMSEACLNLNVWTPAPDGAKRPVFVWIHGGGYTNGSSFEMIPYHGEAFARRGDAVFVSVNHRLNVLGFLDLSGVGGEAFAQSANAGMLDLVAALEWVRDNIAAFGGDPGKVTICGHSGGGGKVNALMRMPSAKGLFHRAIVQSGSFRSYRAPSVGRQVGDGLAKRLKLTKASLAKLQALPYDQLITTANAVVADLQKQAGGAPAGLGGFGWSPTADGQVIIANDAADPSAGIPLMVGYTRSELATVAYDESIGAIATKDAAAARLARAMPNGKAQRFVDAYAAKYPAESAEFLYSVGGSMMFATGAVDQFESRAATAGAAPVFGYRFDWRPDILDKRLGAFHGLEIAFAFDNTDAWDSATGGGERARRLAAQISEAWIAFARTGDPGHRQLARWPAYTTADKSVMLFDDVSRIEKDPDGEAMRILRG